MTAWVLGAADPEMVAIEGLLRRKGEVVEYATHNGERVNAGNAYEADPRDSKHFFAIECGSPAWSTYTVVDHHRPRDPGFGGPPAQYMIAASIGQVVRMLELDICRQCGDRIDWRDRSGLQGAPVMAVSDRYRGPSRCVERHDWPIQPKCYDQIRLIAAADHCLAAAYRGECPGVDPRELMWWQRRPGARGR